MKKVALIVLNGFYNDYDALKIILEEQFKDESPEIVLGVDGGTNHLEALGLEPTHILGDFDSIENIEVHKQRFKEAAWLVYPSEKDYTDSELAFETAKGLGCNEAIVLGAFGGRMDHMLGTVFLLNRFSDIMQIEMLDVHNRIKLIEGPVQYVLEKEKVPYQYVSLIPLSAQATGIDLIGFKYPLNRATINLGETVGISNEIIDDIAMISFVSGKLLMIFSKDSIEKNTGLK
ncbi:thiamine diphosphokinase [Fusibacter ferrireducens]|uniref:Thiamine diphosphokinase n=1 Tax=Fusibacter ferrireducens TaxID=2785058 RepID=A0ABR9ZMI0_9FIRM|nr:thiamine diphosphokinase [Fusibacter ferrireducens]MBF4691678.1 thiamine diphosphokinase [Fusibacter ferrireducens]